MAEAPRCHPVGSQRVWRWQRCHHRAPRPPGPSVLLDLSPASRPGWPLGRAGPIPQPQIWQRFHPKGFKTPPQPRASRSWKSFWGFFFSAAEAELLLGDWRNHKLLLVVSPDSKQIPGASRLPKLQNHLRGWQAEPPSIPSSPLTWGKSFPTQNASWARAACVHETRKPAAATCLHPSAHPSPS